MAIANTT